MNKYLLAIVAISLLPVALFLLLIAGILYLLTFWCELKAIPIFITEKIVGQFYESLLGPIFEE